MTLRKRFHQEWVFECPDAVLTCSILKCLDESFLVFGGHDKTFYLMDKDMNILDDITFDGWCRCSYSIDLNGDGQDEVLVGSGDGSFLAVKLDQVNKKLAGLMHLKSEGKINCCVGGDLFRDGNIEIIFGGEDKSVKIFDDLTSTNPIITLYYDSWVMSITLGFLKLPKPEDPVYGMVIGTKKGLLQFIQFEENKPNITWQQNIFSQINDIKIADVTNDGYTEIIVAADDSYVKILNSEGAKLSYIFIEETRPISILIEDIDGDNANEIIIGCADGSLRIYQNTKLNSLDFELKWKTKIRSSIKHICSFVEKERNVRHIIFGGYDRTIRNIYDYEWGQKPLLEVPNYIGSKAREIKMSAKGKKELPVVPINLREHVIELLEKRNIFSTLDLLIKELVDMGYPRYEVEEELEKMKNEKLIHQGKTEMLVWSLSTGEIIEEPKTTEELEIIEEISPEPVEEIPVEEITVEEITAEISLKEVIINYMKEKKIVTSKPVLVGGIMEGGFSQVDVEKEIEKLKSEGMIRYSRSTPRGWSLVS